MEPARDLHPPALPPLPAVGSRRRRFMESSDFNAAFRAMYGPLRTNIRHGMTVAGQVYAIEMDGCIPGEMLAIEWIAPASRGIADPVRLGRASVRRRLVERLLAEDRPETLFACLGERAAAGGDGTELYLEIASVDACWAASYPVRTGRGRFRRDLGRARPERVARG